MKRWKEQRRERSEREEGARRRPERLSLHRLDEDVPQACFVYRPLSLSWPCLKAPSTAADMRPSQFACEAHFDAFSPIPFRSLSLSGPQASHYQTNIRFNLVGQR